MLLFFLEKEILKRMEKKKSILHNSGLKKNLEFFKISILCLLTLSIKYYECFYRYLQFVFFKFIL